MKYNVVPDYQYHTFITLWLHNHSKDPTKCRLNDINFRQEITQKISSYLIKFFVKNGSKKNLFPVQYVFERKRNSRYHLHILLGRLDISNCLFNKLILDHLKEKHSFERIDYDLIDDAFRFTFRQMKINGTKIVMSGSKALDIRRVWDVEGVKGYLSKYENVRYLKGNQYEYEPFYSIQV
jgi:hypothetical protein